MMGCFQPQNSEYCCNKYWYTIISAMLSWSAFGKYLTMAYLGHVVGMSSIFIEKYSCDFHSDVFLMTAVLADIRWDHAVVSISIFLMVNEADCVFYVFLGHFIFLWTVIRPFIDSVIYFLSYVNVIHKNPLSYIDRMIPTVPHTVYYSIVSLVVQKVFLSFIVSFVDCWYYFPSNHSPIQKVLSYASILKSVPYTSL